MQRPQSANPQPYHCDLQTMRQTTRYLLLCAAVASVAAIGRASADGLTSSELLSRAQQLQDWLVETRRDLHLSPEPGFHELDTHAKIVRFLDAYNITYKWVSLSWSLHVLGSVVCAAPFGAVGGAPELISMAAAAAAEGGGA